MKPVALAGPPAQATEAADIRHDVRLAIRQEISTYVEYSKSQDLTDQGRQSWVDAAADARLAMDIAAIIPASHWWISEYGQARPTGMEAIDALLALSRQENQTVIPWPDVEGVYAAHNRPLEKEAAGAKRRKGPRR